MERNQLFDQRTNQLLDLMLESGNVSYSSFSNIVDAATKNISNMFSGKNVAAYVCTLRDGVGYDVYLLKYTMGEDKISLSLTLASDTKSRMVLSHQYDLAKLVINNEFGERTISSRIRKDALIGIKEEKGDRPFGKLGD